MAHFAELDDKDFVLRVIVVNNNELLVNGVENEQKGIDFCKSLFGSNTNWVQTSYNNNFKRKFAGVGSWFDKNKNMFSDPPTFSSWSLNKETLIWDPPVPYPQDGKVYNWNEEILNWEETPIKN